MRITTEVFSELFGAHIPEWSPSAWVKGSRYEFVGGSAEIDELELSLLGGSDHWQNVAAPAMKSAPPSAALL